MKEQVYTTRFAAKRAIGRLANPEEWQVAQLQGTSLFGIKAIGPKPVVVAATAAPNPTRVAELKRAKAKAATKKSPKVGNGAALGKRAQALADAEAGKMPHAPDFSSATHERFRPKLDELVKLVKAGDVKALKAFPINPISTSPKAMDRYRNLAVIALSARAKAEKEAA